MAKEFKFVDQNTRDVADKLKKSMAGMLNVPIEEINCKGIRFFFVHEPTGVLMSDGLFVDNFSPEDYDDEGRK
jgi:hypothetical protein